MLFYFKLSNIVDIDEILHIAIFHLGLHCLPNEPRHEISNNVVCATRKASDQPVCMSSLVRALVGA